MAFRYLALAVLCFAFVYCSQDAQAQNPELSQTCIGCICEAASGCDKTVGCDGDVCGPFHITWGYWSDGGKPTLNGQPNSNHDAYSSCVNDPFCAAKAMKGYMARYAQDCNGDGQINCDDYARIHYLGGSGCHGQLDRKYETAYFNCRNRYSNIQYS